MSALQKALAGFKAELLIVVATVALLVFYYVLRTDVIATISDVRGSFAVTGTPLQPLLHFVGSAIVLAAFPVLVARFLLGLRLPELGLSLGRWRIGLAWLALGIPLALVAGKIGSGSAAMRFVYPLDVGLRPDAASFLPYVPLQFLYFGAWEVLFRGVLLFGLKDRIGAGPAIALQTALSVVAHFGRPLTETFAALPTGFVFGWVCLHTRSMWYVAVIHWIVGISLDWFIIVGGGI